MTTPLDAVETLLAGVPNMHKVGSVPDHPEYPYGVFSALLGGGNSYTLDSRAGRRSGLASVQTFGRTADSASDQMEQVVQALLDKQLTFDGFDPSTPLRTALDTPAQDWDPDDGGVVGLTLPFTFTATLNSQEQEA